MTPERLAWLHRAAFIIERPWSEAEFAGLIESPHVQVFEHAHGFALARTVAGESELLTLAVDPAHQQRGIGRRLAESWLNDSAQHAQKAFLEVADDNTPALRLYHRLGFVEVGRRGGYYARKDAPPADAIVMQCALPYGKQANSGA